MGVEPDDLTVKDNDGFSFKLISLLLAGDMRNLYVICSMFLINTEIYPLFILALYC